MPGWFGATGRSYNPPSIITNLGLAFPRVAGTFVGGAQDYGSLASNSYLNWKTDTSGAAYTASQIFGAYDLVTLSGSYEGWDNSNSRFREDLTQVLLKNYLTNLKNNNRATLAYYYANMNELDPTASTYATWLALVSANNWWLYNSSGGTGTKSVSAFNDGNVYNLVNTCIAYPAAHGSAAIDQSITGNVYGSLSSGFGAAATAAAYQVSKLFAPGTSVTDSRFASAFHAGMKSPSAAGIFMDNVFPGFNGGGNLAANPFGDGIVASTGTSNGLSSLLGRGQFAFFNAFLSYLASINPGNTYYTHGNITGYADNHTYGTSTLTNGNTIMQGGLLENVFAAGTASWEYWQGSGNLGWPAVRLNYYQGMDFCLAPKHVRLGVRMPATDDSGTIKPTIAVAGSLTTITSGSSLEYQTLRYALCTALLDDGYLDVGFPGYGYAKSKWYAEFGDDSLSLVNVKRGWLGFPKSVRPTSAYQNGVWRRDFDNGISLVNPRGNGTQTVTLGNTFTKLTSSQASTINNGASVSSVTLAEGDGICLLGP